MPDTVCDKCKKVILHGINGWGGDRCMCQMIKPISETELEMLTMWCKYINDIEKAHGIGG